MQNGRDPSDTMPGTLRFVDEATMDRRLDSLDERMDVRYVPCIAMPPDRSSVFESWVEVREDESDCRAYLMTPMSNRVGRELDDAAKVARLVPWNPFAGVMIVRGRHCVFGVADHPFCHRVLAALRHDSLEDSSKSESDS